MRGRMSYDALFSFATFAEHLSFTRAARALHVSQPALHVQVKRLAAEVGVPLYRREGRGLALTAAGETLATFARETRAREEATFADLRGEADRAKVTLASGAGAFVYLLGEAIRRFPKDRWALRLSTSNAEGATAALREARADLAVVALSAPPRDLAAHKLRTVGQHLIVPEGHRLCTKRTVRARDLEGETLVVSPAPSPHRDMLTRLLGGVGYHVGVEASGWEAMLHFAKLGIGLAVVNDFCPTPRGMYAIPLEGAPKIGYFLLERSPLGAGAARLAELVRETAGDLRKQTSAPARARVSLR